ncbi:uncharacterized protein LOC133782829 isoform X4 [Humulus lupulus]|uniref:uncharacterized protein LOC133782829 isoform X4 n=1 Tax=Humulus lupulus TaxID=3486 RepID=UPI002B40887D|nr:uncharacterized protein LOC133782829 isoform X4 [Humulus lupulus]
MMGGICSRKRGQPVMEDNGPHEVSSRYCKSSSSKWLTTSFCRPAADGQTGGDNCPSLLELCIQKIRQDIDTYNSFSMLPRDVSQQIFNDLVYSHCLTDVSVEAFRDCDLQDICLDEYPGVKDSWMDVVSSQGSSLLTLDLSGSNVTYTGLASLKQCTNLQELTLNCCHNFSEYGLKHIGGSLVNLTSLSFKRSTAVTAEGMRSFSSLVNLENLDLERCPDIHGGFIHLKGLMKLGSLNIRCCKCIVDSDLKALSGLCKLNMLNLEGCNVTAACLNSISALVALAYLNLNRCSLSDDGCDKFSGLKSLKVLSLGFNGITDACLDHFEGLTSLESLNLDSCAITDAGLANLTGLKLLRGLELSDTEVGSNGLRYLSGLTNLENLNLSFTLVTDGGLKKLSKLTSLKSLNLDARQITDEGLENLTNLTELTHLDLFGAHITDSGMNYLRCFKKLQSLEICGGGITDAGVKNIQDLVYLRRLNLSQNCNLTNKTLELISGLTTLLSLNMSNSCVTNAGLQYLKPLKNLRSLTLESCKVTASEIKILQCVALPNLINFRPE